jgi:hypothetical protein
MTSEIFSRNASGTIRIVENSGSALADDLAILKGWGFAIENAGAAPFGESQTIRPFADVKLPEGWRSFGSFSPDEDSSYMDNNGSLRIHVTHRAAAKGLIRESYGLSFYDRFSLSPAVTEGKDGPEVSYDRSVIRDNKTGAEFTVGPGMGLNAESDISFAKGNLWQKTLLDLFAPDTDEDPAARKMALAHLWDRDITMDAATAESIRVLVLDTLYGQQAEELQRKRHGLSPGIA